MSGVWRCWTDKNVVSHTGFNLGISGFNFDSVKARKEEEDQSGGEVADRQGPLRLKWNDRERLRGADRRLHKKLGISALNKMIKK